jgi:predicted TIM-barrel fold metal-dependent hydrolase
MAGRIDVHHHLIPPVFAQAMERRGIREVAGAPLPVWTPEASLELMDLNGIQTAIASLSAPGVHLRPDDPVAEAVDLARGCNEFAADMVARHPSRFGFFAVLPMPFCEESCREAIYALDNLNADGVVLLGSTQGVFLGDDSLDELMAELNRRQAIVFIHPNLHTTTDAIGLDMPGFLMEFLCDTTRAACNLMFSGTLEKYPKIRWILAHAGGFAPYIAWRLSLANFLPDLNEKAPQGVLTYLKRFYFDTALSPSPSVLYALHQLVDPSHILFGSDFPFAPAPLAAMQVQELESSTRLDAVGRKLVDRDNALRLFPTHAGPGEKVSPASVPGAMPVKTRIKRAMMKPVVALANQIRDR